ncbi:MAG TPA: DUF2089 family protein [Gammaproteobacteria bacterium]|nr:DUF2089 family protein [Gammaproteobacteria bacterium]
MDARDLPNWVLRLDDSDLQLIRRFVLASGSLKQLAADYDVSYPTIRGRVDALIERMQLLDANVNDDALEAKIRLMVASGEIETALGKEILTLHRSTKGERR